MNQKPNVEKKEFQKINYYSKLYDKIKLIYNKILVQTQDPFFPCLNTP